MLQGKSYWRMLTNGLQSILDHKGLSQIDDRVALYILLRTAGLVKPEIQISQQSIAEALGFSRPRTSEAIRKLVALGIIEVVQAGSGKREVKCYAPARCSLHGTADVPPAEQPRSTDVPSTEQACSLHGTSDVPSAEHPPSTDVPSAEQACSPHGTSGVPPAEHRMFRVGNTQEQYIRAGSEEQLQEQKKGNSVDVPQTEHQPVRASKAARAIFDHWNRHQGLVAHQALTPALRQLIARRIKDGWSQEAIRRAITRYAELKQAGAAPGYGGWGLADLLKRDAGGYLDKLNDPAWEGFVERAPASRSRRVLESNRQVIENLRRKRDERR